MAVAAELQSCIATTAVADSGAQACAMCSYAGVCGSSPRYQAHGGERTRDPTYA